jgi:hypothetical protein
MQIAKNPIGVIVRLLMLTLSHGSLKLEGAPIPLVGKIAMAMIAMITMKIIGARPMVATALGGTRSGALLLILQVDHATRQRTKLAARAVVEKQEQNHHLA